MERSFLVIDPIDFDTFSKNWFEMGIRFPSPITVRESPLATPSPPSSLTSSFQNGHSPFYMDFQHKKSHHGESTPVSLLSLQLVTQGPGFSDSVIIANHLRICMDPQVYVAVRPLLCSLTAFFAAVAMKIAARGGV